MTATNEKPGCLSVIFPFLKRSQKEIRPKAPPYRLRDDFISPKETRPKALPYRLRDDFLSPAEFSFYKVFSFLVGTRLTIQSKVRLADIFFVARPNENFAYFNKIAQKHLDFLVCDSATMKPLFGIELDDSSHKRNNRRERDEFVKSVCKAAGLPLLRFPVQRQYNPREIAAQIAPYVNAKVDVPAAPQIEESQPVSSEPICPKCGVPMVLRTVTKGKYKGNQFYGCQNFPRCRVVKPITK